MASELEELKRVRAPLVVGRSVRSGLRSLRAAPLKEGSVRSELEELKGGRVNDCKELTTIGLSQLRARRA